MRPNLSLPEVVEAYRDRMWCRDTELRVENVRVAEALVESLGFCAALSDIRRPGPSLYIAVCGRRDAQIPRNVQKDPETSLAWTLKDEMLRRGKVYYGKILKGRAAFVSRRLLPSFASIWGFSRQAEASRLSTDARAVLKVLRSEWEMATGDLRIESGLKERARFNKALDELQRNFKVIPSDVTYDPVFTYIWSLPESRFSKELRREIARDQALREIARAYLTGAGMSQRGELARVTGLSAPEAGLGNWALVDEGFAERLAPGIYRLKNLGQAT